MSKTIMPNIPGMEAMTGTLDFVKNLWGSMSSPGMGLPGMIMPTLSVEEINKQITDLKAVESWLTLNMNMLRSTIQALEVQSATISTLQSMGETLSAAVKPSSAPKESPQPVKPAAKAPEPEPEVEDEAEEPEEVEEPEEAPPEVRPAAKPKAAPKATADAAPLANPALWWNMLQDQFKQAVGNAMATETPAAAAKRAKPVAKPAAKTATKKPGAAKPAIGKTSPKRASATAKRTK